MKSFLSERKYRSRDSAPKKLKPKIKNKWKKQRKEKLYIVSVWLDTQKIQLFIFYTFNYIMSNLESFLDSYIIHIKILRPLFLANRYCKEYLKIPSKDLMRKSITPELKKKRKELANKFLIIIKARKYEKLKSLYIVN